MQKEGLTNYLERLLLVSNSNRSTMTVTPPTPTPAPTPKKSLLRRVPWRMLLGSLAAVIAVGATGTVVTNALTDAPEETNKTLKDLKDGEQKKADFEDGKIDISDLTNEDILGLATKTHDEGGHVKIETSVGDYKLFTNPAKIVDPNGTELSPQDAKTLLDTAITSQRVDVPRVNDAAGVDISKLNFDPTIAEIAPAPTDINTIDVTSLVARPHDEGGHVRIATSVGDYKLFTNPAKIVAPDGTELSPQDATALINTAKDSQGADEIARIRTGTNIDLDNISFSETATEVTTPETDVSTVNVARIVNRSNDDEKHVRIETSAGDYKLKLDTRTIIGPNETELSPQDATALIKTVVDQLPPEEITRIRTGTNIDLNTITFATATQGYTNSTAVKEQNFIAAAGRTTPTENTGTRKPEVGKELAQQVKRALIKGANGAGAKAEQATRVAAGQSPTL